MRFYEHRVSLSAYFITALAGGLVTLAGLTALPQSARVPVGSLITLAAVARPVSTPTRIAMATLPELQSTLRQLFEDQSAYLHELVISEVAGLQETAAVTKRLIETQQDIANAIVPYWGNDTAKRLAPLLQNDVTTLLMVIDAAKTGGPGALLAARKKWSDNASAIASLLATANPDWQQATLARQMQSQADLIERDVTARLVHDWSADIKDYDDGTKQMLAFADMIAVGIARQFATSTIS